ncbi:MAG: hypothetical protein ACXVHK_30595 [Solirubrobacteraceae bacterium]
MKFHTDQMDEHKRKLNLRRMRQKARDARTAARHETRKAANDLGLTGKEAEIAVEKVPA